jgi:hypothetical protein
VSRSGWQLRHLCALTAQVAELKAPGCQRVVQEKICGARSDLKRVARLLAEPDNGEYGDRDADARPAGAH